MSDIDDLRDKLRSGALSPNTHIKYPKIDVEIAPERSPFEGIDHTYSCDLAALFASDKPKKADRERIETLLGIVGPRVKAPAFDARKHFGLDPAVWERKDWEDEPCEGFLAKTSATTTSKCGKRPTSRFPALDHTKKDPRFCRECAIKWADFFTKIVNKRAARHAKEEAKGAATIRARRKATREAKDAHALEATPTALEMIDIDRWRRGSWFDGLCDDETGEGCTNTVVGHFPALVEPETGKDHVFCRSCAKRYLGRFKVSKA